MQSMEGGGGRTIGFRLEAALEERLNTLAKNEKKSPGSYARDVLIEHLAQDSELSKVRERMTLLESQLVKLRSDLALATEAILTVSGKGPEAREIAAAWVRNNLNT